MAKQRGFVYKITMLADVAIARNVYVQNAPSTVHMLLCSYCLLDRWEHVGLSSPYWRWYWNDRLGASIGHDGARLPLGPGRAVLVPPNTAFSTHTAKRVGHFHCHFWLGARPIGETARPTSVLVSRADQAKLQSLGRALTRNGLARQEPHVSLSVLSFVADALARAGYEWDLQSHDPLIDRVRQRLHAGAVQRELDNAMLATEFGLSVNTLLRRFRRATGTSPRQFLIQLRVERGAELLRSTDRRIVDIADLCGFIDRYHFTRVFTTHVGTSPAAFRQHYRQTSDAMAQLERPSARIR
jgi:AraC-like DNA-binding protein